MVPCKNIVNFNAFVTNDLILSKPHYFYLFRKIALTFRNKEKRILN